MSKRLTIRIPEQLDTILKKQSDETGESVNTLIRQCLMKYYDKPIYKEE